MAESEPREFGDIIVDICELPDRTSPDDAPDMMLVTGEELTIIMHRHLDDLRRDRGILGKLFILMAPAIAERVGHDDCNDAIGLRRAIEETYAREQGDGC